MSIKNTVEFSVDIKGESSGQDFVGSFTVKTKLSIKEHLRQDELYRSLLGADSQNASIDSKSLATALAYLATRIVTSPEWWKKMEGGLSCEDINVISEINNKCIAEIEKEYATLKNEASAAEEALKGLRSEG
jgi:hypothetical protein